MKFLKNSLVFRSNIIRIKNDNRLKIFKKFESSSQKLNAEKSSCPAGTPLNLKLYKNVPEAVSMDDDEYPEWLWNLLDKKKLDEELKKEDYFKWMKKKINAENRIKIKKQLLELKK